MFVQFLLPKAAEGTPVKLEFLGADNKVLRTFEGKVKPAAGKTGSQAGRRTPEDEKTPAEKARLLKKRRKRTKRKKKIREEIKLEPVPVGMFSHGICASKNAKKFDGMILWNEDGLNRASCASGQIPGAPYRRRCFSDQGLLK